eukprot:GSChrysophyteH1.ASY1.ANO1.2814.1 assembled CDS
MFRVAVKAAVNRGSVLCSSIPRASVGGIRSVSALVNKFDESVAALPGREAVRYTQANVKWTASEFKSYADAHANALLEHGFTTGDTIAVWLPDSAEKHITLMAAAKMGVKVVDIDISISKVADLRAVLKQANAKALFFEPVTDTGDNLLLLRKSIPEFFHYDDKYGQEFHSKYFPSLKWFVHTGFDLELGCLNYRSLFLKNPDESAVDALKAGLSDDLPLYARASPSGELNWITQGTALKEGGSSWGFANKLITQEYFESD